MADDLNVNTGTAAGSRVFRNLIKSGFPNLTRVLTLVSGESVAEGEVCAKQTSSTNIVHYEGGGGDGFGTAYCIALEAIDATSGDTVGTFLMMGVVNKNEVVLGDTGDSADSESMYDDLRTVGIHLVDSVGA